MKNRMAWEKRRGSLINFESTKSFIVFMAVASIAGCSGADKTGQPTANSVPDKNTAAVETSTKMPDEKEIDKTIKEKLGVVDTSYLNFKPSKKSKNSKKDELNANFHFNKANQLREKQDYDEAILEYKRAIRSNPADGAFYKNLGGTFAMVGKYGEAEAVLRKGCEISPDDWLMWNNLAVVLQQLNKNEECKDAIKKSLALKPPKHAVESMNLTLKKLESNTN